MGKLHEILAVETDLKATADKLLKETLNTFNSKAGHFEESDVRFHPDAETAAPEAPEVKVMVDRVRDKIKYTTKSYARYIDSVFQKESANQKAKADLILEHGAEPLMKDVPATVLLGLETKLKEVRAMYEAIPTLSPGDDWKEDPSTNTHKVTTERVRTAKVQEPLVIVQATKEFPAQVQVVTKDVRTGKVVTTKKSSLFTPAEKSEVLTRVDTLIRGVKKARMRANDTAVENVHIGQKLFDYIHHDIVK